MAYQGRRAPNVSQYIAGLNQLPPVGEALPQNDFPLGDDGLDIFANVDFLDFDDGTLNFSQPPPQAVVPEVPSQKTGINALPATKAPQYQFSEFQTYPSLNNSPTSSLPSPATLQGAYPAQFSGAQPGDKRTASTAGLPSSAGEFEDASRFAAEEDKRRRNTAASARFRVKKKQREQALEKQSKEMGDKVSALEGKVQRLEMENKWLKELITEKAREKGEEGQTIEMPVDLIAQREVGGERSTQGRTDGVGTEEVKSEV